MALYQVHFVDHQTDMLIKVRVTFRRPTEQFVIETLLPQNDKHVVIRRLKRVSRSLISIQ